MSRSPEAPVTRLQVRKRDGRTMPFDAERLCASIRSALSAAGHDEPHLGDDLGAVVITYIESHGAGGSRGEPKGEPVGEPVGTPEIADLVRQVLSSSGWENGAYMFERVRAERDRLGSAVRVRARGADDALPLAGADTAGGPGGAARERWSKGRVVALLQREADLDPVLAADLAGEVERGLFASGLRSVGTALLREWVDELLVQRGLRPVLGRRREVFLEGRELRDLLDARDPGPAAESAVAARLLERYALAEVFPPAVSRAHEQGLLHLDGLPHPGRPDSRTLRLSSLDAAADGAAFVDGVRLARRLRPLAAACARELRVVVDRPVADARVARDLVLGLAEDAATLGGAARVVLCLPATPEALTPFLEADDALRRDPLRRSWRLPVLRVAGLDPATTDDALFARVLAHEVLDAGWQLAPALPTPVCIEASVTLNLPRLVLNGARDESLGLLQRFERTLDLALSALAATRAGAAAVRDGAASRTLTHEPVARRLGLCGVDVAAALLARDDAPDVPDVPALLMAVGAGLRSREMDRDQAEGVLLVDRAGPAAARRCGECDRRAHPEAGGRLAVDADRRRYLYDEPVTSASGREAGPAGRRTARQAATLGLPAWAPLPRVLGSDADRAAFLGGYLSAYHELRPTPETSACS